MSAEEYTIRYQTLRSVPTGTFRTTRNGKRVEIYESRVAFLTKDRGEMWPERWRKELEEEIRREGNEKLLEAVKAYVSRHCIWMRRQAEVLDYALDCVAGKTYLSWDDFREQSIN